MTHLFCYYWSTYYCIVEILQCVLIICDLVWRFLHCFQRRAWKFQPNPMLVCWIPWLPLTSTPSLLQSKVVEDPVAILQAAHSAATKVWPWLQLIVFLVASPLVFQSDVCFVVRVCGGASKGVYVCVYVCVGGWFSSYRGNPTIFTVAVAVVISLNALQFTTCCPHLNQGGRKDTKHAVLVQLSDIYYVSLIACLIKVYLKCFRAWLKTNTWLDLALLCLILG